jgi:hypothetical protein
VLLRAAGILPGGGHCVGHGARGPARLHPHLLD